MTTFQYRRRLLSETRGSGCPYIRGLIRNRETEIDFGEIAFSGTASSVEITTEMADPKVVIATPHVADETGAYVAEDQVVWRVNSGGNIELVRTGGSGSTNGLSVSYIIIGLD